MKTIRFVKQFNAPHNPETNFAVSFGRNVSDMKFYNLYSLPKYVKKFMATHTCEIAETKAKMPKSMQDIMDNEVYCYIYRA